MSSSKVDVELSLAMDIERYLQDEYLPDQRFCVICMLGFSPLLGGNAPAIPILQTYYHGFLDTCMRNIAVPLTEHEERALYRRLRDNTNRCNPPRRSHSDTLWHFDHHHVEDPRDLLRSMLCQTVRLCLYGFDKTVDNARSPVGRAFHARKRFRSSNGAWPTSVDQLFPFGEAPTIEGIIDSCCTFASREPLLLLRGILELARPRVWGILLQRENQHRLIWAITTTILLGLPDGYSSLDPGCMPHGCCIPRKWRSAQWLRDGKGIHATAAFLETIRRGNYARPDDAVRFTARHAVTVRAVFGLALRHYDETEPGPCKTLRYHLSALDRRADARFYRSDADLVRFVEDNPRDFGVLRVVRFALHCLPADRRCSAPQCARTMLDREDCADKPLSVCARCTVALYCTTSCQKSDWKHGKPVPHKTLCPVLAALRDAVDRGISEKEYILALQRSAIPDEDFVIAGRWALSKGITLRDRLRVELECV
ncbi:hypothetical protein AURDEDRAFT_173797 [Auricularia subglabra TFB-10046 SS5]|nr:hypothetical protein AURDEDRAFT_173797 [Auricularia subglabra TFB-10046 SS5]